MRQSGSSGAVLAIRWARKLARRLLLLLLLLMMLCRRGPHWSDWIAGNVVLRCTGELTREDLNGSVLPWWIRLHWCVCLVRRLRYTVFNVRPVRRVRLLAGLRILRVFRLVRYRVVWLSAVRMVTRLARRRCPVTVTFLHSPYSQCTTFLRRDQILEC